jgi:hypothetical protein
MNSVLALLHLSGRRGTGIAQRADCRQYSSLSERCGHDVIGPQDMEYCLACSDKVVGNYSSMASPPQGLSAHCCRCSAMSEFSQSGKARSKLTTHGVVRIIVKAPVFPKCIHADRNIPLLSAETAQLSNMLVANSKLGQSFGELCGVVLGIGQRARNASNVDDELNFPGPQQVYELAN